MSTVTASEARQTLPAQLDRVEAGEEVAITRHGRVVAVLVHPNTLRARRTQAAWEAADAIAERLARARSEAVPPPPIPHDRAEELIAAIRQDRAAR